MEIENIIRYTERAVGLKPSARQGEACLRGLYRSISSKTIRPRLCAAKPACVGESGLFVRRPSARRRRSPIGYRLSTIPQPHSKLSYRLLAISYRLSAIGYRLSAIGYRLSAIGYRLSAIVQCRFDDTLLRRPSTGSAVAFCSPRNPGAGFTQLSSDAEKIMHWRRNCPGRSPGDATATAEQAWSENDRPPGSALLPVTLENNMP